MRRTRPVGLAALLLLAGACAGATKVHAPLPGGKTAAPLSEQVSVNLGTRADGWVDFEMDGGLLEFELFRAYRTISQIARNHYAAPMVVRWSVTEQDNLESDRPVHGIAILPAAAGPNSAGPAVLLYQMRHVDRSLGYRVQVQATFRFGDPRAEPTPYAYGLPYPAGMAYVVGQGFGGSTTHTGANQYALDFECPEGTPILAMRPGLVVATNAAALHGSATDYHKEDWARGNFVLVLHEDGTVGNYWHLAPGGVSVKAGQRVERGARIGTSGSTGFATGPHLHVEISTATAEGGLRSFPFRLSTAPGRDEAPVEGQLYRAWESY